MKVVCICGTELAPSGKWSSTFFNNVTTYVKNHKYDDIAVVDARDHIDSPNPLGSLWKSVATAHAQTDLVIYSGHSSPLNLLVFHHCRANLPNDHRYIGGSFAWEMPLSDAATIILWGCQTAGVKGVKSENSIAQFIANKTRRRVFGFVWRSSQQKIGDGYYQQPEHGGLVEVIPMPNGHIAHSESK